MPRRFLLATAAACAAAIALSGCESKFSVSVPYSKLLGEPTLVTGTATFHVLTCADPNTGLESNFLLEAKQKIGHVFPDSRYVACKKQNYKELAVFEIPVLVGGQPADCGPGQICVAASRDSGAVVVSVGPDSRERLRRITRGDVFESFKRQDMAIGVALRNDSQSRIRLHVPSAFLNTEDGFWPLHDSGHTLRPGDTAELVLSNVAAAQLLAAGSSGDAPFGKAALAILPAVGQAGAPRRISAAPAPAGWPEAGAGQSLLERSERPAAQGVAPAPVKRPTQKPVIERRL